MPKRYDWTRVPAYEPHPGVTVRTVHGAGITLCHYRFRPGATFPHHAHSGEQVMWLVTGEMEFTIGDEMVRLEAGDVVSIGSHMPHSSTNVGSQDAIFINVCSPQPSRGMAYYH